MALLGLLPLLFSQLLVTATLPPAVAAAAAPFHHQGLAGVQPLSRIAIHRVSLSLDSAAYVKASPLLLGRQGEDTEWVTVEIGCPKPSADDWIGVFSPANFNSSTCFAEVGNTKEQAPHICSAPIKYQFANFSNPNYAKTGKSFLRLQLINQRADFSFALFSGGLSNPNLVAVSNVVSFADPKAPVYPRLAHGKSWNEMPMRLRMGKSEEITPDSLSRTSVKVI